MTDPGIVGGGDEFRGSGGRKSPSGSRAKPGRGSGGRSPPETELFSKTIQQTVMFYDRKYFKKMS